MLKGTLIFVTGLAIGSCASYVYLKQKYEKRLEEEIADLDRVYDKNYGKKEAPDKEEEYTEKEEAQDIKKSDLEVARDIIQKNDYASYSSKKAEAPKELEPFVIDEDQYDCDHDYTKNSVLWHSDGVIVDDVQGIKIDDPEETIGTAFIKEFEDPDVDVVYVRNEKLKIDFEVCRDLRSYREMVEKGFYQV